MTSWTATASSSAANKIPERAGGITSAAYTAGIEEAAAARADDRTGDRTRRH